MVNRSGNCCEVGERRAEVVGRVVRVPGDGHCEVTLRRAQGFGLGLSIPDLRRDLAESFVKHPPFVVESLVLCVVRLWIEISGLTDVVRNRVTDARHKRPGAPHPNRVARVEAPRVATREIPGSSVGWKPETATGWAGPYRGAASRRTRAATREGCRPT